MPQLNFTVDSALLRELGERLVGKPHIALAELVKNSYDADASNVTIELSPADDRIEVRDDGHGMEFEEFRDFWMRIGTPHKGEKRFSKYLQRPLTGSKGVGRLAVQFLAASLTLTTVPREYEGKWLEAKVDWVKAVEAGDLTSAAVEYAEMSSPPPFERGTAIVLTGLKHSWDADSIQDLARELWWLQPPFRSRTTAELDPKSSFEIDFESTEREFERVFDRQIRAILRIWTARLVGKNEMGNVTLSLEYAGESPKIYTYEIGDFPHNRDDYVEGRFDPQKNLSAGDFEIRIFRLRGRQAYGILVGDARDYFEKYGGIHVYDGGFHLPYYGMQESDWLGIEYVHSHRRTVSQLLPQALQSDASETGGLSFLPTRGRYFGVLNVDTSSESNLHIMITRDRLADTTAFQDLVAMVRYAMDLYAMEEARRKFRQDLMQAPIESIPRKFERVERVLDYYEPQIPEAVYHDLRSRLREVSEAAATSQERVLEQIGLLGALATAGISALAYQHELTKQFASIEAIVTEIKRIQTGNQRLQRRLRSLGEDLSTWVERARATNALFDYLADPENTQTKQRFRAFAVLEDVKEQTQFLARGIKVDLRGVDQELYLPRASLVEWGAIFQNVFTNAFNAMLDSEKRLLRVSSRVDGQTREIVAQDTGVGVDLEDSAELFLPFVRKMEVSPERQALGYGGTGLGLTIVRLLADNIGCRVAFVEPEDEFSTAFSLSWRETR